jgi:metal-responsive CopG/Arc/MetJ family transcriptional regulator
MNYHQAVDICCKDLRRYLVEALATSRGDVVSVKTRRVMRMDLPHSDLVVYAACLSRLLSRYRWGKSYVIPRSDVVKMLENFDKLCESAKRREPRPRRRRPADKQQREETRLVAILLTYDLLQAVDAYAAAHKMSRSAVIRQAIQQLIVMRDVLEELNKAKDGPLAAVTVRIPVSMLNELNEYAAELKAPRSALVRYAVAQMLRRIREEGQTAVAGHA